tara:strand:- start:9316 stop:9684 length:369 start_codon:yes stop_codon:yes gene_type:complete
MTMKTQLSELTVKEVETKIRALAAESPDFTYNETGTSKGCHYHKEILGSKPNKGCIFGQAFQRLGVETTGFGGSPIHLLWNKAHSDGQRCPGEWTEIQEDQDTGSTWGDAIKSLSPAGQHTA